MIDKSKMTQADLIAEKMWKVFAAEVEKFRIRTWNEAHGTVEQKEQWANERAAWLRAEVLKNFK